MRMALSYLQYRRKSKNRHGVHSPFVYGLNEQVINAQGAVMATEIEKMRHSLAGDRRVLEPIDYGAGSRKGASGRRTVAQVVRQSATQPRQAAFLQRLATYLDAHHVLELGTNLGLTTAYLAASPAAKHVLSIEGDPALHHMASQNLSELKLAADLRCGEFSGLLPATLRDLGQIDFAYLDGNHRLEPTLEYFEEIAPFLSEGSVVVVGDIHWSAGMEEAWRILCEHSAVTISIDLFYMGLLFFRKGQAREHFILKHP